MSLELLTPMNKLERVSRKITPASFTAEPGIWAVVQSDGSLANVTTSQIDAIHKLVITSASSNVYESHDVEVGRITSMESHGVRVKVDTEGYIGTPAIGENLYVSNDDGSEGKLADINNAPAASGTYEIVARCEQAPDANGYMIYRTISPTTASL